MEAVWIVMAIFFGLGARVLGLPSLVGYLSAGFAIAASLPYLSLYQPELADAKSHSGVLDHLAHVGVLLLLFSVGLKIKLKQIIKPEVIGTGAMHALLSVLIFTPVLFAMFADSFQQAVEIAAMLSFSSTVLAANVLESKQETKAFHGRIAIGILIVQDLLAMLLMSVASGELPSVWAIPFVALVLLGKPLYYKLLDMCGHDELLLLAALGLFLVLGGQGFHAVNLSGELGALIMGILCAKHPKAQDISQSLWSLKELLLVCFFLSIGLKGLPSLSDLYFAGTMVMLLPLQGLVFFALLLAFKLKARSAFLASVTLTNFSEFSLIAAAVIMPEWTVPLAIAVSLSFLVSAPINRWAHPLFDKLEGWLSRYEREGYHPDETPISLGKAKVLIMGMGRIGRSAYKEADNDYAENEVIGMDSDSDKIKTLQERGYNAVYADAEHGNFWKSLNVKELDVVILAMDCPDAALISARSLRSSGFPGYIVAHSKYQDHADRLEHNGVNLSLVTMEEVGQSLYANVKRREEQPSFGISQ